MNIREYLKSNLLCLDGGMGSLLQARGMKAGELSEQWNISHPEAVIDVHREYFSAGTNVICANTFGINALKYSDEELDRLVGAAMENARAAVMTSDAPQEKWIALDVGPTGRMLAPYGDLDFEDAVSAFAKLVKAGVRHGADLITLETFNDSYETKAALLAAKENSTLPVFVSNAYDESGKLLTGASPAAMVAMLEGMGADAIGVNCSLGPKALAPVVREYLARASVPVILTPNAGLPCVRADGSVGYDVPAEEFADDVASLVKEGVRIAGGCCGTTPEYIRELVKRLSSLSPREIEDKEFTTVSSYTHAVDFGKAPVLIGERINPTGKKRFKKALVENDIDYILNEGITQQEKGVHILDVNIGLPEIDEISMLTRAVCELQAVINLPLQIDTADPSAMEAALRRYNGKAMLNSVNGKEESMNAVFPLAKKYGGVVVALTLDENGIPDTAEGRLEIAKRILEKASEYGIGRKDIIFDPLALTISADGNAAIETLRAVELITNELRCHTSLGVSNVSFGLPQRDAVNSTFFTLALDHGLSAAIINPYSTDMMKAYHAFCALASLDPQCEKFISFASTLPQATAGNTSVAAVKSDTSGDAKSPLQNAIIKGLREKASQLASEAVNSAEPLQVINNEIIPALDAVGVGFENKTVYLPQLLMSAEAAKAAFYEIKAKMPALAVARCPVVLATVKGDIHDIGKNIVKLLLENYGFAVTDLGRDVAPEVIAEAAEKSGAPLVGLSALMTTTVPAMEETIRLLHERLPKCKVVVGGAVLNREYAEMIHADYYAKDAMETVRIADEVDR